MDRESEHDVKGRAVREQKLELSLPSSPQYENKPVSETSLPGTHPMTPSRASLAIGTPQTPPLYTPKRRKDLCDKDIYFAIKWACGILTVRSLHCLRYLGAPLSYEATISDNETQDATPSVLSNAKRKLRRRQANVLSRRTRRTRQAHSMEPSMGSLYRAIGADGTAGPSRIFCYGASTGR